MIKGKQHFVLLAHDYDPKKHEISGCFMSDKLDGMRAIWDGDITAGMKARDVPWCNHDKYDRFVEEPIATGLWSRYGHPIPCPEWWRAGMPRICLDGELYCGLGQHQKTMSIVKSKEDKGWSEVKYHIFDLPSPFKLFEDRIISLPNMAKELNGCLRWCLDVGTAGSHWLSPPMPTHHVLAHISQLKVPDSVVKVEQIQLPLNEQSALQIVDAYLDGVIAKGGEGVIIRRPYLEWFPERTTGLLKVKQIQDAEAVVVGITYGLGKHEARMGSLKVRMPSGNEFSLSGFTDAERAVENPARALLLKGQYEAVGTPVFPLGTTITYTYRELTRDGFPKEARYLRKREN